ncbi:MAG: NAD-dependent malic enzyme [Chloroflexi bacterium]|nr:NAD-dependent malic enzyme [Chloroflexota bacterium]MBI4197670.1 NAD-dependent malic enzyme [Chloroflexota bacterium]
MTNRYPAVAYSIALRAEYPNRPGMLGKIAAAIGKVGGDIGAVDIVDSSREYIVRDITVNARDVAHGQEIAQRLRSMRGVKVLSISDPTFLLHLRGKIEMRSKVALKTRSDMSMAYRPGVIRVAYAIYEEPSAVWTLTTKSNSVAVVTDGTAVLGLGDIGPAAAMPVMEGKAMLFKEMAGVDAWPICLATKDPDAIIRAVKNIAPTFGGINLEDIAAPKCFYIEERLKEELDIPVMHDDQHCTAVVVLAAITNMLKVVDKRLEDLKIVISGAGAAGVATGKLLKEAGARNIIGYDREGILYRGKEYGGHPGKAWFANDCNPQDYRGDLMGAMEGADLFIGVSGPGVLTAEHLKRMNRDAAVFAMANPDPEIAPEEAEPYVRIMATGRSDYPNQINNVLGFPGFFRGLLDCRAREVNTEMKLAAAWAIAQAVPDSQLNEEYIIPSVFDRNVVRAVAREVAAAAQRTGVARRVRRSHRVASLLTGGLDAGR